MTIGDKIYTNDEVQSIDLNGGIQDVFSIGNTPSVCLDLVLRNTSDIIYNTTPINVEIGLNINNKIEYIPLGIFNIDKVKKDDFTIKITAYDNMSKFKVPYFSSLGNTATLTQVANEVAAKTGVQFEGTLPAYTVKKLEGFSCREVLGFIASLCGGNAIIKRNGKFTIVYPTDINRDIGEGVFDFTREEVKYKIGKITCKVEDKTLSKGSLGADSMEIQFENPWMNEAILTGIYKKLNGFEYLGYTLKWQGDPSLDIGDIITYKDDRGVIRKLPIFNRKLSYDGGLDSELFAKGETKNKNSFDSSGSMKKKVDRVVTELAIVNKALIGVAYIDDLTAGNIKFDTASGTIMDLQTLLTKHITGENGQFLNLTTDNVTISNAVLKDVIAANISVQDLKAGNIDANRFNIVGPNGNLVIKDNTIQIKDNARVRVQIGKDASGDYSMYVWDKQGNIMFDALGLKSSAIKDKIIRDDMISDNADINGSKLNISSLITEINKDNTQTLKATKIELDKIGQSLEMAFNTLKTQADGTKSATESNTTSISAIQGKITDLIKESTIEKDGEKIKLKDAYSMIDQTVSGISQTVGDHTSEMDGLKTRVKSAEEKLDPEKIVSTVKDHRTNGVNTFALSSEMKQTVKDVTFAFSSKGGYNLIKNGDVTRHRLNYWWLENGANIWHVDNNGYIGIYKHDSSEGFLVSETIKVEPGKTYSFSCQVSAEGNTLGADVFFIGSSSDNRAYGWTPQLGSVANGESKTIEYTFTVPSNINYGFIRLDANGSTNYSGGFVCWFKNMVLIEGSVPAKTFIPNKSEIYEGSTMVDASGVTIKNGAFRVLDNLGREIINGNANGRLSVRGNIYVNGDEGEQLRVEAKEKIGNGMPSVYSDGHGLGVLRLKVGHYDSEQGTVAPPQNITTTIDPFSGFTTLNNNDGGVTSIVGGSISTVNLTSSSSITTGGKISVGGGSGSVAPIEWGYGGHWGSIVVDGVHNGWAGINYNSLSTDGMYQLVNTDTFGVHDINWLWRNERATFIADGRHRGWVGGYEAYRDGGHFRIAPSDNDGGARWEAFNRYGSIVGSLDFDGVHFRPGANGSSILGHSSYRWQDVYCTRGAFNGSDSKLKENIKAVSRTEIEKLSNDNEPTSIDLYNYVKDTGVYTFNYKNTTNNMLGVLADEIPGNIFSKIGIMTKTEEEYQNELQEQEEAKKVLESIPMPLIDEEDNKLENTIVEGTELTYKELKEKAEKTIEEPMRMINSSSQIAMLQEVLSMALNKIDKLEQRIEELEDPLIN